MSKKERCETCLYSRVVISENGYYPVCCLPVRSAIDCIVGRKSYYYPELPETEKGGESDA